VSIFTPKVCTIRHTIFKHAQQQDTKFVLGIIHLLLKKMDRATGKQEKKEVDSTFGPKDPLLILTFSEEIV
jgi:hypothetical protein